MEGRWKLLISVTIFVFGLKISFTKASSLFNGEQNQAEDSGRFETEHEEFPNQVDLARNVRQNLPVVDYEVDDQETTESTDETTNKEGQKGRALSETGKPDNAIDDFLMHMFNFGVKHTIDALGKFGLPQIDPLKLPDFILEKNNFIGNAKGSATEMAVVGFGGLGLQNLHTDLDKLEIHFEFGVPEVAVVGKYKISATLLKFIQINGAGPFKIGIQDLHFHFGGSLSLEQPITLKIDLCKITVKSKKGSFDKLTGNNKFQEKLSEILSVLAEKVVEMIQPTICKLVKGSLETFVSKELAGVKIPDGLLEFFNKFKSLVSTMNKKVGVGRKKRGFSVIGDVENFSKLAMVPYMIAENRANDKYRSFE